MLNRATGQKNKSKSFMEMIKSAQGSTHEDDIIIDDEEEFVLKKEPSTPVATTATTTPHIGIFSLKT